MTSAHARARLPRRAESARWLRAIGWAALSLVLSCRRAPSTERAKLVVFAAVSTTEAMRAISAQWQTGTCGEAQLTFGPSSDLERQIEAGAPVDLFLSADAAKIDALTAAGLVRAGDTRELLSNQLVVVVAASSQRSIARAADLGLLDRVALANPTAVPAGIYGKSWLVSAGAWEAVAPKVVPTLDVRAALAAVESETVDAAIVYRTDAMVAPAVRVALAVPREQGPKIVYPIAKLASSTHPHVDACLRFLSSPAARAIFERYGFIVL